MRESISRVLESVPFPLVCHSRVPTGYIFRQIHAHERRSGKMYAFLFFDDVLVNRRSSIKLLHTEDGLCWLLLFWWLEYAYEQKSMIADKFQVNISVKPNQYEWQQSPHSIELWLSLVLTLHTTLKFPFYPSLPQLLSLYVADYLLLNLLGSPFALPHAFSLWERRERSRIPPNGNSLQSKRRRTRKALSLLWRIQSKQWTQSWSTLAKPVGVCSTCHLAKVYA